MIYLYLLYWQIIFFFQSLVLLRFFLSLSSIPEDKKTKQNPPLLLNILSRKCVNNIKIFSFFPSLDHHALRARQKVIY